MNYFTLLKHLIALLLVMILSLGLMQAQITVSNDFEGGNGIATFIDDANNEVHLVSELKGGDTKNIVYYVKISGLNPSLPLILAVDATWRGHNLVYSFDQINWHRSNLTALNNFNIPLSSSTIYVTNSYPYTYSDMIQDVEAISDLDFVHVIDMAVSEEGRPVKLVRITDDCIPDDEKELVWVFGRMHAFENPGNLAVVGMMNYFTSNQPTAQRLRKEAIIYIVPMMDVDMAYNGGSGKDQLPVDFNRDWVSLEHNSHWNAVKAAKIWIDSTSKLNNFSVFFESHSPPSSHWSTVFYYVYDIPQMRSNINFVNESMEEVSNYRGEDDIYLGLDISVSQDYVLSIYNNPRHYNVTMETGFKTRPDGVEWSRELYLLNGEYHAQAISEFIHGHSYEDDIIVDNKDASLVEVTGSWSSATDIFGYLGEDYLYIEPTSSGSVVFKTTIDSSGTYEVFTRWVSSSDFSNNASATITHSAGSTEYILDMSHKGGNWISLDTFELDAGTQISLTISNAGSTQTVVADGMRISRLRSCPSTTGIETQTDPLIHFSLYPNPASDYFNVQIAETARLELVKVYDLFGKLVLISDQSTVNTQSLSEGVYFVVVETNQGTAVQKLMVR